MYSKKINQLATNFNPQSSDLIPIGDATTGQLKTITYATLANGGVLQDDGIISGGVVTWSGTGLIFNISSCIYYLNGVRYNSPASTLTLSASDPTNPRIDVFAVNTSSQVVVITGTPNVNPVEPQVDVATQLQLTNVTITAGSTTPSQVVVNTIYDENFPYTTEWVMGLGQGTSAGYSIDALYTGYTAYKGTYSFRTTKPFAGFVSLRWEKYTPTNYNVADYTNLSLAVRITNAFTTADYVRIYFTDSSNTIISNKINLSSLYGFNPNLLNTWQLITIPIADFKILRTQFTKIVLYWNQTSVANSSIGYDAIQLQGGISNQTNTPVSFGYVQTSSGSASSTIPSDTLTISSSGLTTLSATGKTLTIATPSPIPSQTGNNGKYLTTNGSVLSWGTPNDTITTNRQTASYTLILTDSGKLVEMNVATANNLTIPLNSSVAFPVGTKIDVVQYGAGQTTFVATGGVTIRSTNSWLKMNARYGVATLIKIATDEWYLFGNLNA